MIDFTHIIKLFSKLLNSVGKEFSEHEIIEVEDFINVEEYGLALETLIDILIEERKDVTQQSIDIIKNLTVKMAMDGDEMCKNLDKLTKQIK
jgi:hypothetical protein